MENKLKRPERKPLKDVVPLDTPYTIYIDPMGGCNFACSFCPCNTVDYRNADRHAMMSLDTFKKIVDDIKKFPSTVKVVNMYGFGEPLLNPNIISMVRYLKEADVCNEIFMVSNGALLTPELSRELAESGLDLYRVSLEALDSEKYHLFTQRNVTFEKIVENVRGIYEASRGTGLRVEVKTVNTVVATEEYKKFFEDTFSTITDYLRVENVGQIWSEFDAKNMEEKIDAAKLENDIPCSRPFFQMAIHSNGDVSACCADWKLETVYGNVKETSLLDIWNSPKHLSLQKMMAGYQRSKIPFCQNCEFQSPDFFSREDGQEMLGKLNDE